MNYQNIYLNLINKHRENKSSLGERHHIIPDFFFINRKRKGPKGHLPGDPDALTNIIYLPPREHLFAHLLLCKIHEKTRYEYGCLGSIALMMNVSSQCIERTLIKDSLGKGKIYAKRKKEWNGVVSRQFKGTVVAKDVYTNEMIGHVPLDHPNVISGKWVHHTKGTTISEQHKENISKAQSGLKNGNSQGYTDDDLVTSYLKCAKVVGFLPHNNIWLGWAKKNNEPYLKFFKPFRFNNKGFVGLKEQAEQKSGMKFDQKMYLRPDTKNIYNKAKLQWA